MNTNDVALFGFIVSYTKNIKFQKQLHDYTTKCSTEIMPCVRWTKNDICGMIYFVKCDFSYKEYNMLSHIQIDS